VRAAEIIDPAARLRIERAVVAAELKTAGEIVVAVVHACDDYVGARWRFAVVLAGLAFLALVLFAQPLPAALYLLAQVVALVLGHGLARLEWVLRRLLPDDLIDERVTERSRRCFAENGLTRTTARTGILIFVALLEHRVVVLADEGIDRMLGSHESWQEVVDLAAAELSAGRPVEGLQAAVQRCGEILAHHLPSGARRPEELPVAVVIEG
jgi:putative membrane protein